MSLPCLKYFNASPFCLENKFLNIASTASYNRGPISTPQLHVSPLLFLSWASAKANTLQSRVRHGRLPPGFQHGTLHSETASCQPTPSLPEWLLLLLSDVAQILPLQELGPFLCCLFISLLPSLDRELWRWDLHVLSIPYILYHGQWPTQQLPLVTFLFPW